MKWTNTVEAVTEVEQAGAKGQWRIGDAIEKDLSVSGSETGRISQSVYTGAAEQLATKGYEKYASNYLSRLHRTALAFSRSDRDPNLSFDIHAEAGTPGNLKKATTALHKLKKTVSGTNVRQLIKHWREQANDERQGKLAAAKAAKAKAKADKVKATEGKLAAKDKVERDEAEKQRQAAIKTIEVAKEEIRKNTGAPAFNSDLEVDTTDVTALQRWALALGVGSNLSKMIKLARKTHGEVERIAKYLTAAEQQAYADGCDEIMAILESLKLLVKRPTPKLTVHQGGAA